MTIASAYLLNFPGNTTVQISKDELRSLLRDIESELHRSKVYCVAVANLQKLLGSSEEQAKTLFKAVGREAITLAFKQFAQKHIETPVEEDNIESSNIQNQESSNSDLNSTHDVTNPEPEIASSPSETQTDIKVSQNTQQQTETKTPIKWLWQNNGLSKRQKLSQLAAQKRQESLSQIGEQLKTARESQGLTLQKLNIYTHISVHQMEAVENANLDLLPEDILIRGFIRVMANALGLNGIILANSFDISNQSKSILPSWDQSKKSSRKLNLEVSPVHLYVGYTALVAGSLGGLSFISQQANYQNLQNSQVIIPTSSSLCQSNTNTDTKPKTEVNSPPDSICLGANISPPEAL